MSTLLLRQSNMEIEILNDRNENEADIERFVSQVTESNGGIKLVLSLPEKIGNIGFRKLTDSCEFIKSIEIRHFTEEGAVAICTKYKIDEFYGWEMSTGFDKDDVLRVSLDFAAQPVEPVTQSIEDVSNWIKGEN